VYQELASDGFIHSVKEIGTFVKANDEQFALHKERMGEYDEQ
jgi:DNA-binding transcriptional regulator YhcF (GntR family)